MRSIEQEMDAQLDADGKDFFWKFFTLVGFEVFGKMILKMKNVYNIAQVSRVKSVKHVQPVAFWAPLKEV